MRIQIDQYLLVILFLLILTLLLFFLGLFAYPFGIIILVVLLIARILAMSGSDEN